MSFLFSRRSLGFTIDMLKSRIDTVLVAVASLAAAFVVSVAHADAFVDVMAVGEEPSTVDGGHDNLATWLERPDPWVRIWAPEQALLRELRRDLPPPSNRSLAALLEEATGVRVGGGQDNMAMGQEEADPWPSMREAEQALPPPSARSYAALLEEATGVRVGGGQDNMAMRQEQADPWASMREAEQVLPRELRRDVPWPLSHSYAALIEERAEAWVGGGQDNMAMRQEQADPWASMKEAEQALPRELRRDVPRPLSHGYVALLEEGVEARVGGGQDNMATCREQLDARVRMWAPEQALMRELRRDLPPPTNRSFAALLEVATGVRVGGGQDKVAMWRERLDPWVRIWAPEQALMRELRRDLPRPTNRSLEAFLEEATGVRVVGGQDKVATCREQLDPSGRMWAPEQALTRELRKDLPRPTNRSYAAFLEEATGAPVGGG